MNEFLEGLLKSIIYELLEKLRSNIDKEVDNIIEKSRKTLFITGIAISLVGIGFFLISWGLVSIIESIFGRGLGFLITGFFITLIGIIYYILKKN